MGAILPNQPFNATLIVSKKLITTLGRGMHRYEDADGSLDGVKQAILLGIVHQRDAKALVDDLCRVSVLQEQKVAKLDTGGLAQAETNRLSDAVDLLLAKWRRQELMSQTELVNLLRLGLREAELHRAKEWRDLLRTAILPSEVN